MICDRVPWIAEWYAQKSGLQVDQRHGASPVPGPSRSGKTRSARPARNYKCGQDARDPKRNRPKRRPRIWERGRPARNDQCGQDARAPKRNRPEHRLQIPERGRLARKHKSGQDARAPKRNRPEHRPQIPERGRLARKTLSAGVPPAKTKAGKMSALHRGIGLNTARKSGSAGVSAANYDRSEKPRERGFRFAMGSTPRPGVKRRAEDRLRRTRPVNEPLDCPIP